MTQQRPIIVDASTKVRREWKNTDDFTAAAIIASTFSGSGASVTNVDAATLDGIDSASFARSDQADTIGGLYTWSGFNGEKILVKSTATDETASNVKLIQTQNSSSSPKFFVDSEGDVECNDLKVNGTETVVGPIISSGAVTLGDGDDKVSINAGTGEFDIISSGFNVTTAGIATGLSNITFSGNLIGSGVEVDNNFDFDLKGVSDHTLTLRNSDATGGMTVDILGTLAIDGAAITATPAEINQALDGISANVTDTNLNTLTGGGNADALHEHESMGGITGTNKSGGAFAKGDAVYYDSVEGGFVLADADSINTMKRVYVCTETIADDASGRMIRNGIISDISGASFTVNDTIYVSTTGTTGNTLTVTPPSGTDDVWAPIGIATGTDDVDFNINYNDFVVLA